jgi:hypothetical protein
MNFLSAARSTMYVIIAVISIYRALRLIRDRSILGCSSPIIIGYILSALAVGLAFAAFGAIVWIDVLGGDFTAARVWATPATAIVLFSVLYNEWLFRK